MTNQYVLERPKTRARVIAWLIEGKGPTEIAALVSTPQHKVSRQAVLAFKKRHTADIAPVEERLSQEIIDYAIASKVNVIAAQNERWLKEQQVIRERGADPSMAGVPGGKTGLLVRQYKAIGSGRDMQVVEEYKVDDGLLSEMRALERQALEETGQWPKGDKSGDTFNIDKAVLVRYIEGPA